jgi:hypothetical protein
MARTPQRANAGRSLLGHRHGSPLDRLSTNTFELALLGKTSPLVNNTGRPLPDGDSRPEGASPVRSGALGQSYQTASTPPARVATLLRGWSAQLAPRIPAALEQPPQSPPVPLARVLPALFSTGARVVEVPGVPPLTRSAAESVPLVQTVRAALTEARLEAIERLQTGGQHALARSLIAASISAYSAGGLTADQFGEAIDISIREAESYRAAAQPLPQAPPQTTSQAAPGPTTPDLQLPAVPIVARPEPVPEALPQGAERLPPARPANFDLSRVPKENVAASSDIFETNAYPVSGPEYRAPADPLFATLFKALETLGTRELSMGEMAALINVKTGESEDFATSSSLQARLVADPSRLSYGSGVGTGGLPMHDLHKFIGGFRVLSGNPSNPPEYGFGGEGGFIANITAVDTGEGGALGWERESVIEGWLESEYASWREQWPPRLQQDRWGAFEQKWGEMDALDLPQELDDDLFAPGLMADPRHRERLLPMLRDLLHGAAGSDQRKAGAKAMAGWLTERDAVGQTASVSGLSAEIQMLQTLTAYLERNGLDTYEGQDRINWVDVFRLYRQLLSEGALTTRETVEGWLQRWNVPHEP